MRLEFTIPVAPVSKKNHSQIVKAHGRTILVPSKQYQKYEKDVAPFMPKLEKPIDSPVNVQFTFYRDTRRACDLSNLVECAADILVKYGVLLDDNRNILYGLDRSRVLYSKENPRTEIIITDIPKDEFESWAKK